MKFLRNLLFPNYNESLVILSKIMAVLVKIDRETMLEAFPERADVIAKIHPDHSKTIAVKLSQRPRIGADDPRVVVTRYVENADGSLQTQCLDTHGVWQNRPEGFEYEEFDGFHMDRPTYSNGGVE